MKRVVIALAAISILSGCGIIKGKKGPTTPTVGERISVLGTEASIEVDPALAGIPVSIPPAVTNTDWAQLGGNAAKSMTHVSLGTAVGQVWSVSIGEGSSTKGRLGAGPVVGGGKIFTIDTQAEVRAISPENGATLWRTRVGVDGENSGSLFGGGVSFDGGRVYATSGLGHVVALDASNGAVIWRVQPGGPLRGAPTIANDNVYVVSQDNQLYALNPADGKLRWTGSGTVELAGVFGTAAPAASQGTVVAGFSSGELNAYRYENGRVVWQDALARTSISTAVGTLSDIDADPVIDNGRVYAIGQGGRMVAMELNTGQRVWEINAAGIATPWVAGEWIFVVTDQAKLLAIARATGKVRWMTQLLRYRDEEDKKGPISWVGPILAGDRLILASSVGHLVNVSPTDGAIQSIVNTKDPISLQPAVANNTLYILHDNGQLTAWR
ncbi:outer membrane protein assembly factor BamB family protein [Sphingosinicella rhizophila]|uniref:PQQ-binding-like beta-propeller repeat protein n=1 Tax=Sphingosinicella rhizophila TaxID=3050082 RepID=A0ABU3Q3N1_9SPHN|nr:PQQ-binding-like beta-propeller repeat protein [Sphingosinicella sp. GR2756]MDT9598026.1 PQQ-binding-like beta-propeller repeat protein [Sphingosinicella sp. GR2756]